MYITTTVILNITHNEQSVKTPSKQMEHFKHSIQTFPPLSIVSWTFFRKSRSRQRFESRIVVAYVDSDISRSGRHLSIHAAPRWRSDVIL